jgi:hypothetical protein
MTTGARRGDARAPVRAERRDDDRGTLRVIGLCNLTSSALCLLALVLAWLLDHPLRIAPSVFLVLFVVCLALGVFALRAARTGRRTP